MFGSPPVLIVDLAKYYGGADVRVLQLARNLHGKYPYEVATLHDSPLQQKLAAEGLNVLAIPYSRSDPRTATFIARHVHRAGYQVIDAHNPQSQLWTQLASFLSPKVKRVSTVHSSYGLEHQGSLKGRFYENILRLNRLGGFQFIAVTEAVYSYLKGLGIAERNLHLIHNSIEAAPIPNAGKSHPLFESLGWGDETFVVVVVARLEPVKGHQFLIEAIQQTTRQHPELRCLIVGDGRLKDTLAAQIEGANLKQVIHLAGFRDDISALLAASDAFCLPSLSEGLPFALLEAAMQRLPLLVSQVGGMAELLTHRQTGYLVPAGDPAGLSDGLEWLLTHRTEAQQMGGAAFELVSQRFNLEAMIQKTLGVYWGA